MYLQKLEKEEQIQSKLSRRKEIMRIRVEINKIKNRKPTEEKQRNQKLVFRKHL